MNIKLNFNKLIVERLHSKASTTLHNSLGATDMDPTVDRARAGWQQSKSNLAALFISHFYKPQVLFRHRKCYYMAFSC